MAYRIMVSRKEPTLQETASVGDGIAGQQNTNRDNSDTDERHTNDTPEGMKGNDHATPRIKIQKQWKPRNQATQEQVPQEQTRSNGKQKVPYVEEKEKTEIAKLMARHPEMPDAAELSRDDRDK